MSRIHGLVAAAAVAAAAALAAASGGNAAPRCGSSPYAYAGLLAADVGHGVAATIGADGAPDVRGGHVAAWVGVGGQGLGPAGTDEWLQVGISVEPDHGAALYYELAEPRRPAKYVVLLDSPRLDRTYRVAVLESHVRRGSWAVWLNGTRVTKFLALPGSHGMWRPVATTESWNGGVGACNRYRFTFDDVQIAAQPGGRWTSMPATVIKSPGFAVRTSRRSSFVALGGA